MRQLNTGTLQYAYGITAAAIDHRHSTRLTTIRVTYTAVVRTSTAIRSKKIAKL